MAKFLFRQYLSSHSLLLIFVVALFTNYSLCITWLMIIHPFFISPLRHIPHPKVGDPHLT